MVGTEAVVVPHPLANVPAASPDAVVQVRVCGDVVSVFMGVLRRAPAWIIWQQMLLPLLARRKTERHRNRERERERKREGVHCI